MTDRDPYIASLFHDAEEEFADDVFTSQVMSAVDNRTRRSIIGWVISGLVLASCAFFVVLILQDAIFVLKQLLPDTIIGMENRWFAQFLAPVNSVSGLIGLGALGVWAAFRKLF